MKPRFCMDDCLPPYPKAFCTHFIESIAFENAVASIPNSLMSKTVQELEQLHKPTEVDHQLKLRLWSLINGAIRGKKSSLQNWYKGICSYNHLYYNIFTNPERVAWLIKPGLDFEWMMRNTIDQLFGTLREVLELPLKDERGRVVCPVIEKKFKAFKLLTGYQDWWSSISTTRGRGDDQP